jgi:multiple sugar transport system permease protein
MSNTTSQASPIAGKHLSVASALTARHKHSWNWGVMLVIPYVIAVGLFAVGPALVALVFSFSEFGGGKPQLFMAGLGNYIAVFSDKHFIGAYWNVIRFSLVATSTGFIGSVGIALLLSLTRDTIGGIARSAFFLPGSINGPALALMFLFMLDPSISPFAPIFRTLGWAKLTDFVTASNAILVMAVIRFYLMSGGWIAIFYAALESVSLELIEAAKIDGCGAWRLAWDIRRPAIMGFVWFMVIQLIANNMMIFSEPYLIATALGGASFINPFWSPNMVGAYYTMALGNFGMSSVVAISQIIITSVSSIFIVTKTGAFITEVTN